MFCKLIFFRIKHWNISTFFDIIRRGLSPPGNGRAPIVCHIIPATLTFHTTDSLGHGNRVASESMLAVTTSISAGLTVSFTHVLMYRRNLFFGRTAFPVCIETHILLFWYYYVPFLMIKVLTWNQKGNTLLQIGSHESGWIILRCKKSVGLLSLNCHAYFMFYKYV